MKANVHLLATGAVFVAAATVATMIHVPAPTFQLYFHLGEAVVYTAALLMGRRMGALVGGLGPSLADLLLGYAAWAPITLVVKGLEGFVVGHLAAGRPTGWRAARAIVPGALVMIAGYALAAWQIYGPGAVPVELAGDTLQCAVGGLVAVPLAGALRRILPGGAPGAPDRAR